MRRFVLLECELGMLVDAPAQRDQVGLDASDDRFDLVAGQHEANVERGMWRDKTGYGSCVMSHAHPITLWTPHLGRFIWGAGSRRVSAAAPKVYSAPDSVCSSVAIRRATARLWSIRGRQPPGLCPHHLSKALGLCPNHLSTLLASASSMYRCTSSARRKPSFWSLSAAFATSFT